MINKTPVAALLLTAVLATMHAHGAALLEPGDAFPDFSAQDQHGADYRFETGTKTVLVAFDMATSKLANRILAAETPEFLDDHHAVYISDIHGMPSIGRYFAFPKMRKYPHRIIVADAEHLLDPFPREEGRVTVIRLDDNAVVESIRFWNPEDDSIRDVLP